VYALQSLFREKLKCTHFHVIKWLAGKK